MSTNWLATLLVGHFVGIIAVLVAVPAYMVVCAVAIRFFHRFKAFKQLLPDLSEKDKIIENTD